MKITAIKKNKNNPNRFSVFIDDKFAFSVSDNLLIKLKINKGDELSKDKIGELTKSSNSDKIYSQTLKYATSRLKTKWEIEEYLNNKNAPPALKTKILNKLSKLNLINDYTYCLSFIRDKQRRHPCSKLKLIYDLKKRRVNISLIEQALEELGVDDTTSVKELIESRNLLNKYRDKTRLMRYLTSQGFNYSDIKSALNI